MKLTPKQYKILYWVAVAAIGALTGLFVVYSEHRMIHIMVEPDCLTGR